MNQMRRCYGLNWHYSPLPCLVWTPSIPCMGHFRMTWDLHKGEGEEGKWHGVAKHERGIFCISKISPRSKYLQNFMLPLLWSYSVQGVKRGIIFRDPPAVLLKFLMHLKFHIGQKSSMIFQLFASLFAYLWDIILSLLFMSQKLYYCFANKLYSRWFFSNF